MWNRVDNIYGHSGWVSRPYRESSPSCSGYRNTVGVDVEMIRKYVKYQNKQELWQQELEFRK